MKNIYIFAAPKRGGGVDENYTLASRPSRRLGFVDEITKQRTERTPARSRLGRFEIRRRQTQMQRSERDVRLDTGVVRAAYTCLPVRLGRDVLSNRTACLDLRHEGS